MPSEPSLPIELLPFSSDSICQEQPQNHGQQRQTPGAKAHHSPGNIMNPQSDLGSRCRLNARKPRAGHFLDNQDEAKKYEGKQVNGSRSLGSCKQRDYVTKVGISLSIDTSGPGTPRPIGGAGGSRIVGGCVRE